MTMPMRELRLLLLALQFLTRLPVPCWVGHEPELMRRAARHFPLVGALIGAAAAGVALAAHLVWSAPVAAGLAVAFTVWLTAALHEDGLADTADALLGASGREKALAILKDSRIGTYGAAALGLVLLLRVVLAADLMVRGAWALTAGLIAANASGRALAVLMMCTLPYAGDEALAKTRGVTRDRSAADTAWACFIGALMLMFATTLQPAPLATLGVSLVLLLTLFLGLRAVLQRRLAGYTGDTLGAAEQLGEVAVLLALAGAWTP